MSEDTKNVTSIAIVNEVDLEVYFNEALICEEK